MFFSGVQLSRNADFTAEFPLRDAEKTLMVFKFMKVCFVLFRDSNFELYLVEIRFVLL